MPAICSQAGPLVEGFLGLPGTGLCHLSRRVRALVPPEPSLATDRKILFCPATLCTGLHRGGHMCPQCERATLHPTGTSWVCATCGLVITEQALRTMQDDSSDAMLS